MVTDEKILRYPFNYMYEKIKNAIAAHVKKHRLVFWYDEDGKHRPVLEELDISGDIIEVANNEWWIKHHLLKERPDDRFLIYSPYPRPADKNNWLLDLVLSGFSFSHDLSETHREELGLGPEFRPFIQQHISFFHNLRDRFEPLRELVTPDSETPSSLAVKMLGIVTTTDAETRRQPRSFGRIFFSLAEEAFAGLSSKWESVEKYELDAAFRFELRGYISIDTENLEPHGAAIAVFREAWSLELGQEPTVQRRNSRLLLQEWKDQYGLNGRYRDLAKAVQEALGISYELKKFTLSQLAGAHLFPAVDSELALRLVSELMKEGADQDRLRDLASKRLSSYWVRDTESPVGSVYALVIGYIDFERTLHKVDFSSGSVNELSQRYVTQLYLVDRFYRNCLFSYRSAGSPGSLSELIQRLEGRYLHKYLQPICEKWDNARTGETPELTTVLKRQRRFFDSVVAPFLEGGEKLVVIISDALRYEAGKELQERLTAINRVSAEIEAMVAAAPTITAIGMNALLPHDSLSFSYSGTVLINGQTVSGIVARSVYLAEQVAKRFPGKKAAAFRATDISSLPTASAREKINGLDLIYIFSNGIDAAADNAKTEMTLPDAVDAELESLNGLIRKFGNQLNRTHILVTADHGFLYQSSPTEDMHLIAAEKPSGGQRERRYVVGGELPEDHFFTFDSSAAEIESERKIHFAEGLYRIRKQGRG